MIVQSQLKSSEKANFSHLVGDIAWFGLAMAATSRFLSVYAIRLGATPIDLGWISALPSLILLFSASLGAWWTQRYGNPVRSLFWPGLTMRFLFLLPVFAPLLPLQWQPLWLIFSVSAPAIGQGVASVSFFAVMRSAIEPSHMTRLLSHRQFAVNVSVAVAALAFGLWLEGAPFPLNYQVMFLAAFAFSLVSLYHCIRIRVADQKRAASETPVVTPAPKPGLRRELSRSIGDSLRVPWRSHGFRRVALVTAVVHLVFFILVPVTPLFLVRHFGADEGYMALFGLLELAGGATASVLAPRIQRRIGTRPMIGLAMIGTALAAVIIAFAPNLWVALISAVISGACWTAAAGVGLLTFFLDNTPAEESTTYSTAYHQVIGLVVFIGPMVGSMLANGGVSLIVVMMFGAAVRFLAAPLIESSLFSRRRPHREPMPNAV